MPADRDEVVTEREQRADAPKVKWNVEHLKSSYVNVANVNSTAEEVVLNFGLNAPWDGTSPEVEVDLSHRIVMNPYAAKRLAEMLNEVIDAFESRFGDLE